MNNSFYKIGSNVSIAHNVDVNKPERTAIGNNSIICPNCWLCIHAEYFNRDIDCNIILKENVYLGRNSIIESFNLIKIDSKVIIGPNVYISDNYHSYEDFTTEISLQGFMKANNKIIINSGTWIGEGVSILGNVTIGYGSVVGSKSMVNKDIPNHCVVIGVPAKIIKICDYRTGEWIDVKENLDLLKDILESRGNFRGYNYYNTINKFKLNNEKKTKNLNDNKNSNLHKEIIDEIDHKFQYVLKCFEEGKNEELINMLKKIIEIISKIKDKKDSKTLNFAFKEIKMNFNMLINFYENKDFLSMNKFFKENFILAIPNLVNELRRE